jgi:hypothetical protein
MAPSGQLQMKIDYFVASAFLADELLGLHRTK